VGWGDFEPSNIKGSKCSPQVDCDKSPTRSKLMTDLKSGVLGGDFELRLLLLVT